MKLDPFQASGNWREVVVVEGGALIVRNNNSYNNNKNNKETRTRGIRRDAAEALPQVGAGAVNLSPSSLFLLLPLISGEEVKRGHRSTHTYAREGKKVTSGVMFWNCGSCCDGSRGKE